MIRFSLWVLLALGLVTGASASDWGHYGATEGGIKYSPLDQINRDNVAKLREVWRYQTGEGTRPRAFQVTPIVAGDLLVGCTTLNIAFALNPATGEEVWRYDPHYTPSQYGAVNAKCRGVSAFTDADAAADAVCKTRIIWGTGDLRIIAVDAHTGTPCPDFGDKGEVKVDAGKELTEIDEVQFHSPPSIVNGMAIFGTAMFDLYRKDGPSGKVRAFDARTGALKWEFDPVPRAPSDPAYASWGKGSAEIFGSANVWSFTAADPENDLVFLPTTTTSVDWYGGDRPGDNLYANSIVALRATSGEMVWHYQIVHHGIWDYDLPSQPIVTDIEKDGEIIPALVVLTKQSLLFIFNRLTGEPVFGIEERPVPQHSEVPGETVAATQPFPVKPAPLNDIELSEDDMWGFTFIDRNSCVDKLRSVRNEGIYTPPSLQGSLLNPSGAGGMNWGGGAVDPDHNLLIVPTFNGAAIVTLIPREEAGEGQASDAASKMHFPLLGTPYVGQLEFLVSDWGAPCTQPPWARLSAVDLSTGELKWQVALGSIINESPVPFVDLEMGSPIAGGPIVTGGGLAFIGASTDDRFRAFDIETGEKVWETTLPAGAQATPMTYEVDGTQYVVTAAGGHIYYQNATAGDYIIAFAVDENASTPLPTWLILAGAALAIIGVIVLTRRRSA